MGSCQSSTSAVDANKAKRINKDNSIRINQGGECSDSADSITCSTRHSRQSASTRERMKLWKEELEASGNLTKTVVNIETSLTKQVESVYEGIHNGPILGTGVAGIVRKCRHRQTGVNFAVKCLNIGLIESDAVIETLREEIFIMCQADHPDIIRLEEVYESDSQIYLILHLLTGGDMFDRLEEEDHYSEIQCAQIVKQMTSAVRYLHSKKVIHRDLKLENFIFDDEHSDNIRLIDFGLSKHFDHGEKHNLAVGTPYTVAPEIIEGEYDEKVDVWALGIITYLLLCGDPPFGGLDGECLSTVRQNILDGDLVFEPSCIWDGVSEEAKNFIRRLLTKDPSKRPTAEEAQNDEWLVKCASLDVDKSRPLNPNLVKNLIKFQDYSNLQKTLLEVVSFTLLPEQIKDLKREFEKVDVDGNGEITLEELKEVLLSCNYCIGGNNRKLTEPEVEKIFDSLHINTNTKSKTIKWHKFITAGLSRCDYDDRNLRLAFNRLDRKEKGYITIGDLNEMLRSNDGSMDEVILDMWKDGMTCIQCKNKDRIYFEDFQCFFKVHNLKEEGDAEKLAENHQLILESPRAKWKERRRASVNSQRLVASTFALDIDGDDFSDGMFSCSNHCDEDDLGPFHKTDRSRRPSFHDTLRPLRSNAVLVKRRSRGPLE